MLIKKSFYTQTKYKNLIFANYLWVQINLKDIQKIKNGKTISEAGKHVALPGFASGCSKKARTVRQCTPDHLQRASFSLTSLRVTSFSTAAAFHILASHREVNARTNALSKKAACACQRIWCTTIFCSLTSNVLKCE